MLLKYVVLIGNPGVGKSTILNGLVGRSAFECGLSFGGGLTQRCQFESKDGVVFTDSPGLSDVSLRDQASREIRKALSQDGSYRIFFVVTLESGRVRPDDVTTIRLVVQSVNVEFSYGIIVNKASKHVMGAMQDDPRDISRVVACLNASNHRSTSHIIMLPYEEILNEKDNAIPSLPPQLTTFINSLPPTILSPDMVGQIPATNFEDLSQHMKKEIARLEESIANQKQEMERIREEHMQELERVRNQTPEERKNNSWDIGLLVMGIIEVLPLVLSF